MTPNTDSTPNLPARLRWLHPDGNVGEGPRDVIMRAYAEAGFEGKLVPVDVIEVPAPRPVTLRPGVDVDPEAQARALRPLSLPAESLAFWRWPRAPHQGPALYLVLDRPEHLAQPLLLYVGETARADQRWKGAHDCKSYLAAYREAPDAPTP